MTIDRIKQKLNEIKCKSLPLPPECNSLQFNSVISEADVYFFENKYKFTLPSDMKMFITTIGNGGHGPGFGLKPLNDESFYHPWFLAENGNEFDLSMQFPYTDEWNFEQLRVAMENNYENKDELMKYYFSIDRTPGCFQVCDWGNGGVALLVVNGDEYGKLWIDYRYTFGGVVPEILSDNLVEHISFCQWYEAWLDEIIMKVPLNQRKFR
ncbi:SMI1/KNR4 family protein [Salmonella enterica subsp. enterica]|nr:SMI1/KNR4 family protein [Salmonella enterica subsp. enterica serovar Blijdorp]